ncbi:MAG: hemolysin family protein [Elusimicrobiota bacterium]|jgi:CBS domain containing-hemolysin-like protein|nr:hemolysin family protein [Elusimicrobiota bacterium]
MYILLGLAALIFCLAVSTWISAAEIAITSLSNVRVKKLIAQKPQLSKTLFAWLQSPHNLLTLILTINVIADMLISFFSTFIAKQTFFMLNRHITELIAWIVASFVTLIIGETAPKIYARKNPEKITIFSSPILAAIEKPAKYFLYPIVKLTEFITPKAKNAKQGSKLLAEEIETIINEGGASGELDNDTGSMLKRTLRFGELSASSIMTPLQDIDSVDLSLEYNEFLERCIETARSRIPVWRGKNSNILGYIHIKDILQIWRTKNAGNIYNLIKPAYFIDGDKKINELLREFQSGRTHTAFIKNKEGAVIGMASMETILEKIVGEIADEYETDKIKD